MWALDAEPGHILHRIGSDDYTGNRHAMVRPEALDLWEEVAESEIPSYRKERYDAEVERLIGVRYTHGKEIEINREREINPERYAEYLAYIEECKRMARETLSAEAENIINQNL